MHFDDPAAKPRPQDRSLLHNLPSRLRAYGREKRHDLVVVVLVDLDERPDCIAFKTQMTNLLNGCHPRPRSLFRIAIEELEAWFLGDQAAIQSTYPRYQTASLQSYQQDTQCGTWEILADVIHPGGRQTLLSHGKRSRRILEEKRRWAKTLCPQMQISHNLSPSFQCFVKGLQQLATISPINPP